MTATRWFARQAWLPQDGSDLGRVEHDVLIAVEDGRIAAVRPGAAVGDATPLPGLVVPGLANVHSHAFHRVLRARTDAGIGTFWSWRQQMYAVAQRLDPDRYRRLARAVFAEMALAGITAVGEFHYVHHRPGGRPYADPNAMSDALADAASQAGVRLTLIDACYLRGGFDQPPDDGQRRFSDGDAPSWAGRVSRWQPPGHVRLAAGVHSVRAVADDDLPVVRDWAEANDALIHVHLSEQPAENDECLAATGMTPTALLAEHGLLGRRTTAIHATHVTAADVARLGDSGTSVCLCPTTERSLADGIGPAGALADAGTRLCLGSDSHAVIDLFEEARAVELDERLASRQRGRHRPEALIAAATQHGMASLGWDAGRIAAGRLADLVAVDVGSVGLAGYRPEDAAAFVVFAASAADVTHVVAAGKLVVADRQHLTVGDVAAALRLAIADVTGDDGSPAAADARPRGARTPEAAG